MEKEGKEEEDWTGMDTKCAKLIDGEMKQTKKKHWINAE